MALSNLAAAIGNHQFVLRLVLVTKSNYQVLDTLVRQLTSADQSQVYHSDGWQIGNNESRNLSSMLTLHRTQRLRLAGISRLQLAFESIGTGTSFNSRCSSWFQNGCCGQGACWWPNEAVLLSSPPVRNRQCSSRRVFKFGQHCAKVSNGINRLNLERCSTSRLLPQQSIRPEKFSFWSSHTVWY